MYIYLFIADYLYFKKHYEFIHSENYEICGDLVIDWAYGGRFLCPRKATNDCINETKLLLERKYS